MPQIAIDSVNYELDDLSENAKQQLANVQITDAEIARLQTQLAIANTARLAYASALKAELPAAAPAKKPASRSKAK